MEMKRLNATGLRAAGYDERDRKLVVETTSGTFEYENVSPEVYRRLINSPSPASYYRESIEEVLRALGPANLALAVEIARIPEMIRGYGHVKARHLAAARPKWDALMADWRAGPMRIGGQAAEVAVQRKHLPITCKAFAALSERCAATRRSSPSSTSRCPTAS